MVAIQGLVPVGLALFPPYLFVDHPWGVLSGRETGLPKIPSTISPIKAGEATFFEAVTYAAVKLGTGQEVRQLRVFEHPYGRPSRGAGEACDHRPAASLGRGRNDAIRT